MTVASRLLAIDLGADSGRAVVGTLRDGRFDLQVVHRFANGPQRVMAGGRETLRWDIEALWQGIREGLRLARLGGPVTSVGVDTWGVDYVVVDRDGNRLEQPWHYRDDRTIGVPQAFAAQMPVVEQFRRSGVRGMIFNTIFQLIAHQRDDAALLRRAHALLHTPDYLAYRLSGVMAVEWSIAGTGGLTHAGRMAWDDELIRSLGLPAQMFGRLVPSGTVLGQVLPQVAADAGCTSTDVIQVIATGGHDTASAVAAMPTADPGAAYISCGTWSLMGVLATAPCTGPDALAGELSNEIAVDGRIRLLKNIMGLWVWQETRRDLIAAGIEHSHAELADMAAAAAASASTAIDINDPALFPPSSDSDRMIERIRRACAAKQIPCATTGELFRRIVEGLVAAYATTRQALEHATGRPISTISIMGGGCRNRLLCQLTANATGLTVLAGPDEGTALGNLLVQARALGLTDDAGMAELSRASSEIVVYSPR